MKVGDLITPYWPTRPTNIEFDNKVGTVISYHGPGHGFMGPLWWVLWADNQLKLETEKHLKEIF